MSWQTLGFYLRRDATAKTRLQKTIRCVQLSTTNMKLSILLSLLPLTNALYFYLEGGNKKCIIEDLPHGTMVVGQYKAEEYNKDTDNYVINPNLGIQITVEVFLAPID